VVSTFQRHALRRAPSSLLKEGNKHMLKPVRRSLFVVLIAFLSLALGAQVAFAGSPHFVGTPTISRSGDSLTVSGKVAGLGDETQITVLLSADVACVNPGTNEPKAENKDDVIAQGRFPVQNGKANFSVTGTGTTSPDCSPPMTLRYSNVTLTVSGDSFDPDLVYRFPGTY
jgi:hypothetical protein